MSTTTTLPIPAAKLRILLSWTFYAAACIVMSIFALTFFQRGGLQPFGTYWASGNAAIHGLNPYAAYPETFRFDFSRVGGLASSPDLNLNPPCLLPLLQLAAHLPVQRFAVAWTIGSWLLFTIPAALLLWFQPEMQKRQILWLLLARPIFDTFLCGQIYALLFCLSALACLFYKSGRETAAAVMIGLFVSIKPTMAFWPVFLYLAGHRRIALRSMLAIFAVAIAPLLLYGPAIYREWLAALADDQHWRGATNIALIPLFRRFDLRQVGVAFAAVLALSLFLWAWKKRSGFASVGGVAICAGILCAPLAWYTYALWLAPFYTARRWSWLPTVAAILFVLPPWPGLMFIGGISVYLSATMIILAVFLANPIKTED